MKIARALLAGVMTIFNIGCVTGSPGDGAPPTDPGSGSTMVKDHVKNTKFGHFDCKDGKPKHKMPLSIYVDATEESKVFFPEEVGLCKNKTDLVWVAFGASSLEIKYKPTEPAPPRPAKLSESAAPCHEMLDADNQRFGVSCVLNKFSHKDWGSISYDIVVTTKDGTRLEIDPQLIIQK